MSSLKQIQNISFIGSGNVATHLALAFRKLGSNIVEVYSPNNTHACEFTNKVACKTIKKPSSLNPDIDLVLLAVPDAKVEEVYKALPEINGIVAHTSGFCPMSILSSAKHFGVFYPLQTFTKDKEIDFSQIPFCIEGNDEETAKSLIGLANKLSESVNLVNSQDRRYLHLAAVMVNNFANHIYHAAEDILNKREIDFKLLLPLIKETANKVEVISPDDAQTGPAKRNDLSTIDEHEKMLSDLPEYKELYKLISAQITKKYHG